MRPLAALVAIGFVVASCGSDDDKDSGAATTAAAATTPPGATTGSTGGAGGDGGTITVGSADFSESVVLAEIYAKALEDAGFKVERKLNIGSREVYYKAIDTGEIDLVPEYTNSLLTFVLRQDDPNATADAVTVPDQIAALADALPDNLEVLEPSTAEDKDVIVCTSAVAEKYKLTNLTELGAVADQIKLGAPPEFESRSPFGIAGFKQLLGAKDFKEFVPLRGAAIADALKSGAIDCGNIFSTLPVITTEGFVALEDDKNLVPHEAVLPLISSEAATDDVTDVLNQISTGLTTDVLKELLVKTDVDAVAPAEVAKEYVESL
jgi:osmoprotectant transport system substrate-binding protein